VPVAPPVVWEVKQYRRGWKCLQEQTREGKTFNLLGKEAWELAGN